MRFFGGFVSILYSVVDFLPSRVLAHFRCLQGRLRESNMINICVMIYFSQEPMLHASVVTLLPTMDSLVFAIDVQDLITAQAESEEKLKEEYAFLK